MLMNVLPGAASGDFASFATGVSRVQQLLGAHFAPAQGGSAYTSAAVGRLMQWIGSATTAAIGQSSWGPTGFAVLPSAAAADALLARLRAEHAADPALTLHVVAARQAGALIHPLTPAGAG
jgi:predicted sugar kinase